MCKNLSLPQSLVFCEKFTPTTLYIKNFNLKSIYIFLAWRNLFVVLFKKSKLYMAIFGKLLSGFQHLVLWFRSCLLLKNSVNGLNTGKAGQGFLCLFLQIQVMKQIQNLSIDVSNCFAFFSLKVHHWFILENIIDMSYHPKYLGPNPAFFSSG